MSAIKKIIIIGGGFAGVWSALSAMRHCRLLKKENDFEITLINKDEYHGLRPRFYEEDLTQVRVPLTKILTPFGIKHMLGEVSVIDTGQQKVAIKTASSELKTHDYDRLILASGSHLYCPLLPGLSTFGFNVDTYSAAHHLAKHLHSLHKKPAKGRYTAVIVGGGFTGLEVATDLIKRLKNLAKDKNDVRVIIVDHNEIGSTLGAEPNRVIQNALHELKIETKTNVHVSSIEQDQIILDSGEVIDTQTVIWSAGMRASPLTKMFSVELDRWGRLLVDVHLRMNGIKNCFAAGDVAAAMTDETHLSMMSCQHAMPQGRVAGHNAVADLVGEPLVAYEQKKYVTILDLGEWGGLCTEGWERKVVKEREAAKKTKLYINHERIYPLTTGKLDDLFNAAAPVFKPISQS